MIENINANIISIPVNIVVNDDKSYAVNYSSLLSEDDIIMDNTTIMLLNLLCKIKPTKVYIAGCDGYKIESNNYYQQRLQINQDKEYLLAINDAMVTKFKEIKTILNIEFLTPSLYDR